MNPIAICLIITAACYLCYLIGWVCGRRDAYAERREVVEERDPADWWKEE